MPGAGYSTIDAVGQPYPVIYLNDGQNLFGDCPTMSGQFGTLCHMHMWRTG
jgi:predicted alpha/beta superfamily hydrolase